jgi:hypothetical protein
LPTEAARLFRRLALHPGPDFSAAAAASLAGVPVRQVRPALSHLANAHLVRERVPGRYDIHRLLHAYAGELTDAHDTEPERHAATARMIDHYLHTLYAVALTLDPRRTPVRLDRPVAGAEVQTFTSTEAALEWFADEHPVLCSLVTRGDPDGGRVVDDCLCAVELLREVGRPRRSTSG